MDVVLRHSLDIKTIALKVWVSGVQRIGRKCSYVSVNPVLFAHSTSKIRKTLIIRSANTVEGPLLFLVVTVLEAGVVLDIVAVFILPFVLGLRLNLGTSAPGTAFCKVLAI